jgi:hypothetical protein
MGVRMTLPGTVLVCMTKIKIGFAMLLKVFRSDHTHSILLFESFMFIRFLVLLGCCAVYLPTSLYASNFTQQFKLGL